MPATQGEWPDEWKDIYYKDYPRFARIALPDTQPQADLYATIKKRESRRSFSKASLSMEDFSTLLKYSCGIVRDRPGHIPARAHPSGGGRYPLEAYVVQVRGGALESGLYHYNVRDHALDVLWKRPFTSIDIATFCTYRWAQSASALLFLTATFERTQIKYSERGYRYVLLETGHVMQNVCLVAESLGIAACPIVGIRDEEIERLIDIDGVSESVLYAVALGYPQDRDGEFIA